MGSKYIKIAWNEDKLWDLIKVAYDRALYLYDCTSESQVEILLQYLKQYHYEEIRRDVSSNCYQIRRDLIEKYLPLAQKEIDVFTLRRSEYKDLPIEWVVGVIS